MDTKVSVLHPRGKGKVKTYSPSFPIFDKQHALHDGFAIYFNVGQAEGMNIPCFGSHDTSPPRGSMWKTVPHRLFFGRSSTPCWGTGGVAFLNPEINHTENSYVCMYKITYVICSICLPVINL